MSLVRPWWSLFDPGGEPNAAAWDALGAAASVYEQAGVRVAFTIAVVDRTIDVRQTPWTGNWASDATFEGAAAVIDRAFETFGSTLGYLGLGYEIDRWIALAPQSERSAFLVFGLNWLDYARQHDARPAQARIGVTATSDALAGEELPELLALSAASDVLLATYVPHDDEFTARSRSRVASDLDALVEAVAPTEARRLALVEVGYPSQAGAGSSLGEQREFFQTFFSELAPRAEGFEFVNVRGLHDLQGDRCAFEAAALGAEGDPGARALRCSLGLLGADSAEKPAYRVVVDAFASLSAE